MARGGLARKVTSLLREKYARDSEFKCLIDHLNEGASSQAVRWLLSFMREHGDRYAGKIPMRELKKLFDKDLVSTIKDRIQAPVYHEDSEEDLVAWLKKHGFTRVERLTRCPRYQNVRRFLSPLTMSMIIRWHACSTDQALCS